MYFKVPIPSHLFDRNFNTNPPLDYATSQLPALQFTIIYFIYGISVYKPQESTQGLFQSVTLY